PRPRDYETLALPLSYAGTGVKIHATKQEREVSRWGLSEKAGWCSWPVRKSYPTWYYSTVDPTDLELYLDRAGERSEGASGEGWAKPRTGWRVSFRNRSVVRTYLTSIL